jgi:hypothetical protein
MLQVGLYEQKKVKKDELFTMVLNPQGFSQMMGQCHSQKKNIQYAIVHFEMVYDLKYDKVD